MGVSQARSRNYPILGAHQQVASPPRIKMGHPSSGDPALLSAWHLADKDYSPSPARRNHSLPPCVDAMDDALPIDSGTHHDNVGNRVSPPSPGAKFSRKRLEKEKAPQGRLFDSFA